MVGLKLRKQYSVDIPINAAYQHPYYLGSGAAAIIKAETDYYYHDANSLEELTDHLVQLAVLARAEHQPSTWNYHFRILRAYSKIDIKKAKPKFDEAINRLSNRKRVDLDHLLKEPQTDVSHR